MNPYRNLPSRNFWKKAISSVPWFDIDPMVNPSFTIQKTDRVATAGSCFAQHIAKNLARMGFNYFVTEQAPDNLSRAQAIEKNYGTFSARYGNIYTARQLKQLWMQSMEDIEFTLPEWKAPTEDGYVDPLRPQIQPDTFQSVGELIASRKFHLECCRRMFNELDVFVFTLGLTEGWIETETGTVLPLAPGVAGGEWDPSCYHFTNFGIREVIEDLDYVISRLAKINPKAKVILTVSPVPLVATYENRHVLSSTVYSKSVLRVAAEEISNAYKHRVDYFPSFEIITGPATASKYFSGDLRTISPHGVNHVMRVFFKHYAASAAASDTSSSRIDLDQERASVSKIICDEEALDRD